MANTLSIDFLVQEFKKNLSDRDKDLFQEQFQQSFDPIEDMYKESLQLKMEQLKKYSLENGINSSIRSLIYKMIRLEYYEKLNLYDPDKISSMYEFYQKKIQRFFKKKTQINYIRGGRFFDTRD